MLFHDYLYSNNIKYHNSQSPFKFKALILQYQVENLPSSNFFVPLSRIISASLLFNAVLALSNLYK